MAEKFEYGGGKALPDEMTGPVMSIPSEQRWKDSEAKRVAAAIRRRKGLPDIADQDDGGNSGRARANTSQHPASMFDQASLYMKNKLYTRYFSIAGRFSVGSWEHIYLFILRPAAATVVAATRNVHFCFVVMIRAWFGYIPWPPDISMIV